MLFSDTYLNCEGLCTKDPGTYICNGQCQSSDLPCNGDCLDKDQFICGDKCVTDRRENVWECDGRCLNLTSPCNGACPKNFWKCPNEDKCILEDFVCSDKFDINQTCSNFVEHSKDFCEKNKVFKDEAVRCLEKGMIECKGER